MFVKLYTNQVKDHLDIIRTAIDKSFSGDIVQTKTQLVKDIMLGLVDVWLAREGDNIEGVFISRVNNDYVTGRKSVTIIAVHKLSGDSVDMFMRAFMKMKAIVKEKGYEHLDFYTNNPKIIELARMHEVTWEAQYFQLKF